MIRKTLPLHFFAAFALFCGGFIHAQLPPPPRDPAEQLRDEREQERLRAEAARQRAEAEKDANQKKKKEEGPKPIPPEPKPGEPAFKIDTISVDGVTQLENESLEKVVRLYRGKRLNVARIDRLISDLTDLYIDEGFITSRVYIPPQDISTGTLKLTAVEGKIQEIRLANNKPKDKRKLAMAMPKRRDGLLQLQFLEQGIDQINRVGSTEAKMKLEPGDEPGDSIVVLQSEPKDVWRGSIGVDSFGNDVTGEIRGQFGMEWDNFLGINDSWSAGYLGSVGSNAVLTGFSFPYKWTTIGVSGSYSEYSVPLTSFADLFGQSVTGSVSADTVVYRDQHHKTTVSVGVGGNGTRRFVNDFELDPQDYASVSAGVSHLWRRPETVITASLGFTRGLDLFSDPGQEGGFFGSALAPNPEFNLITAGLSVQHQAKPWLIYEGLASGQYALDNLFSPNQIYLGDYFAVRGYRDSGIVGDYGGYLRNDFTVNFPGVKRKSPPLDGLAGWPAKFFGAKTKPYVFVDGGYTHNRAGDANFWLSGGGGGFKFEWDKFKMDAYAATPLWTSLEELEREVQFYVSFGLKVF